MAGLSYFSSGTTPSDAVTQALKTQAFGDLMNEVFRGLDLLSLFDETEWLGGNTYNIKYNYAGNTNIATYSEGDPPPQAMAQSYITASWPESHYHASVAVTGHMRDYMRGGGNPGVEYFNVIANELVGTLADFMRKMEVDFQSAALTSPIGIRGIVDDAGTIAGLSRTTYTWMGAIENACSSNGAVALSDIDILYQELRDTQNDAGTAQSGDPATNIDIMIGGLKVERKLADLWGRPNATSPMAVPTDSPAVKQLGNTASLEYNKAKFYPVRGFATGELLMGSRSTIKRSVVRNWQIDPLAKIDDTERVYLTYAWAPICYAPRKWGKLTGC